jgi:GT2 family glycosyltransferase
VRRDAFDAVGGFNEELPLNYNDVDFSLKLRAAGHRIIWTPFAVWYHFESQTRQRGVYAYELAWLAERWGGVIGHDPYLNPNLAPARNDFLERPPAPGPLRREPV